MKNKILWKRVIGCVMLLCILTFFSYGFIFGCNVPGVPGSGGGGSGGDEETDPLSWLGYINAVYVKDSPEKDNNTIEVGGIKVPSNFATDYQVVQGIYAEVAKIILLGLGVSYGVGLSTTATQNTNPVFLYSRGNGEDGSLNNSYYEINGQNYYYNPANESFSTLGTLPAAAIGTNIAPTTLNNGFLYKRLTGTTGTPADINTSGTAGVLTVTTPQIKISVDSNGIMTKYTAGDENILLGDGVTKKYKVYTIGSYDAIREDSSGSQTSWKWTLPKTGEASAPTTVQAYLDGTYTVQSELIQSFTGFSSLTEKTSGSNATDSTMLFDGNTKKLALEIAKICTGLSNPSNITNLNQAMPYINHIGFTSAELQKIKSYVLKEIIGADLVRQDDAKLEISGQVFDTSNLLNTDKYYMYDHYYTVDGKVYAFDRNGDAQLNLPANPGTYKIEPGFKNYRGRVESIFDIIKSNYLLRASSGNARPSYITAWGGDYIAPAVGDLFMVPNATRIEYTLGNTPIEPAGSYTTEINKYNGINLTGASNTPTVAAPITGVSNFTIQMNIFGTGYDFIGFEKETYKDDLENTHERYYMPKRKYIAVAFDFAKPGFNKCYYLSSLLRLGQISTDGYSQGLSDLNIFEDSGYALELLYNANEPEYTDINENTAVFEFNGSVASRGEFEAMWTNKAIMDGIGRANDTNGDGKITAEDINADWYWQDITGGTVMDIKSVQLNSPTKPFWYAMLAGGDTEKIMKVIPAPLLGRDPTDYSKWLNPNEFKQSVKLSMQSPYDSAASIAVNMDGIKDKPVLTFVPNGGKFASFAIYSLEESFAVQSYPVFG